MMTHLAKVMTQPRVCMWCTDHYKGCLNDATQCMQLTLTMSSPMTIVNDESMVVETSLFLKSMDTRGKSETAR